MNATQTNQTNNTPEGEKGDAMSSIYSEFFRTPIFGVRNRFQIRFFQRRNVEDDILNKVSLFDAEAGGELAKEVFTAHYDGEYVTNTDAERLCRIQAMRIATSE